MRLTNLIGGRPGPARRFAPLLAVLLLGGCGSDRPPPLTGNVVDARGAHAGSFRPADAPPANAAVPAPGLPNTQEPLQ